MSDYFGSDVTKYAEMSPQASLVEGRTPALYVLTEFDMAVIEKDHLSLINNYVARWNRMPHFLRLLGHNHFTAVASLNTPDTYLGDAILAFMDGARFQ